ncbi:hypothetical protein [Orenia marismortui]|uniref:Uncharacterized protein n=1 Tax=Orenia marismortui TaxID=46469 RepID=A0A4V3GXP2_9FIRM|nr:hypothetical protein [Orenia marismortui]TDX48836.1 hypothetical protein C7959_12515 [Orenia marismortui]
MGIVVDSKKAKKSPCKCIITGDPNKPEDRLCFSKGIVGALSDEQELEYCTDILAIETSKKFADRINRFRTLGDILDICLESEEKDFLGCIESQARNLKSGK